MIMPKLENPWNVVSLYEFQYFNCPSCEFKHGEKQDFLNHAYESHPDSIDGLSNITDGSLEDILCPWDSHENENEFLEVFKTEDDEDIPDINDEESNQNDHVVAQIVKCYYCAKEMNRSIVRTHMEKSHSSKPVIFNIIKDTKCIPKDDKRETIESIKEEEINSSVDSTI